MTSPSNQPSAKDFMAALGIGSEDSCPAIEFHDEGVDHFEQVLLEALQQVVAGKGEERHGHGLELYAQPWMTIASQVGNGFLTGQAIKKLMEAASTKDAEGYSRNQYERELLGAIAYTAFAIMHLRIEDGKDAD